MHQPVGALPGGLLLLNDPAAQAIAAQVFGARVQPYRQPEPFVEKPIAPVFVNGWANYPAPFNPAGYFKDRGLVYLRGMIQTGTIGLVAFTLPVGYRPANTNLFVAISNGALGRFDVLANGDVIPTTGSNVYMSLDGAVFRAA